MNRMLLVTRPNYDAATNYLFYWSKSIINLAKNKRIKVIDLTDKKANKSELINRLKKLKPSLLFFNGHGNENVIFGQDGEELITNHDKIDELKNTIIYSRSCASAKKLGQICVKNGVKVFIGYTEPFIFAYNPNLETRPLADKLAKLFLEPSNLVVSALLKNHQASKANTKSKEAFKRNIRKLLTSETTKENTSVLRFLIWDMKHQVCLGNKNARIT